MGIEVVDRRSPAVMALENEVEVRSLVPGVPRNAMSNWRSKRLEKSSRWFGMHKETTNFREQNHGFRKGPVYANGRVIGEVEIYRENGDQSKVCPDIEVSPARQELSKVVEHVAQRRSSLHQVHGSEEPVGSVEKSSEETPTCSERSNSMGVAKFKYKEDRYSQECEYLLSSLFE